MRSHPESMNLHFLMQNDEIGVLTLLEVVRAGEFAQKNKIMCPKPRLGCSYVYIV
jgi:hypothetical protein